MYAVDGMWLSNAELTRLNAFHCQCIRKILKIKHSFYSRVSNETVLELAKAKPLTTILARNQLKLFGRIALLSDSHILRLLLFDNGSFAKPHAAPRRRGRPRASWIDGMHAMAIRVAGSDIDLSNLLNQCSSSLNLWMDAVDSYLSLADIY